ncbi:MAG: NAD(P)H-hydrate dehydratase [Lachnospiraceae bacterium]|nr:NAD(P)H-hydrate dehydratase [Lachnospiraceae bacterium]
MEYLVTQSEMKQYDNNTITLLKMPSLVLMERAALITVSQIRQEKGNAAFKVLVVAGCGNNGGDGFAIGRLLMLEGCKVDFVLLGSSDKCSAETTLQLEILNNYGYEPYDRIPQGEYDIVIDAVFGVGLSRNVEGIYKEAICAINELDAYICSVDIPSGIHADSGKVLGCAVKADLTVTYGFYKLGEFLYPGTEYCGKIICGEIGIDEHGFFGNNPKWFTYTSLSDLRLPERKTDGNKGTFGKVLVIAGNDNMCGAAVMSAKSVFYMGAGMVRMITSNKNRDIIQQSLPEAMLTVYDSELWTDGKPDTEFNKAFNSAIDWADCILIGPGIGTGVEAEWMLDYCINKSSLPLIIDADGLNLLATKLNLNDSINFNTYESPYKNGMREVVLTPHMGEFARLYGCDISEVKNNFTSYPKLLADKLGCTIVCKDARTVVASYNKPQCYLNTSGNSGMATAGSGDVLAGMITGLLAQGMKAEEAAVTGVYLHGVAGDIAAHICGNRSMMATDIIEQLKELLKKCTAGAE